MIRPHFQRRRSPPSVANGVLQNVVQPIAFGGTLDLNPLAVLVVTIAAGCLFGMG